MQTPPAERNPPDSAGHEPLPAGGRDSAEPFWALATGWVALVLIGYLVFTVLGSSTVQRLLSR